MSMNTTTIHGVAAMAGLCALVGLVGFAIFMNNDWDHRHNHWR